MMDLVDEKRRIQCVGNYELKKVYSEVVHVIVFPCPARVSYP
jgi:hypothetical protein